MIVGMDVKELQVGDKVLFPKTITKISKPEDEGNQTGRYVIQYEDGTFQVLNPDNEVHITTR